MITFINVYQYVDIATHINVCGGGVELKKEERERENHPCQLEMSAERGRGCHSVYP